jgi:DNA-binding MarR family transcriptional regulator
MNPTPSQIAALTQMVQEMARRYLLIEAGLASGIDDITKRELQVIELVSLYQVSTVTEVASAGKVPLSTASWIVNRLVDKDYLVRQRDPDDRRVIHLELGPAGKRILMVLEAAFAGMARQILEAATPDEAAALVSLSKRLVPQLRPEPVAAFE